MGWKEFQTRYKNLVRRMNERAARRRTEEFFARHRAPAQGARQRGAMH